MSRQLRVLLHHDGKATERQLFGMSSSSLSNALLMNNNTTTSTTTTNIAGNSSITITKKQKQKELEDFLYTLFTSFGTIEKIHYHTMKQYQSILITYKNHITAIYAYAAMNDPIQFMVVLQSVIGSNTIYAYYSKVLFVPIPIHDSTTITTRTQLELTSENSPPTNKQQQQQRSYYQNQMYIVPKPVCTVTWID